MKIWGGRLEALPSGKLGETCFPKFPPKGGRGETFPKEFPRGRSVGEQGGTFPTLGDTSPWNTSFFHSANWVLLESPLFVLSCI